MYQNYTELSYLNGKQFPPGVTSYDTTLDPTIDDTILPGEINESFATPPPTAGPTTTTTSTTMGTTTTTTTPTTPPLPTKSTVWGGVISTPHGDNADFAGIFAADTSGVFVGTLPKQSSG